MELQTKENSIQELKNENVEKEERILTKKDVTKSWWLWWLSVEVANSFERLQALACCISMIPILRKLYKNEDDFRAGLKRHLQFFNTESTWGAITLGVAVAMEEQKAMGKQIPDEAINSVKTGLMGPFAGIGDTINWATFLPILLGFFIPVAESGNWIAGIAPLFIFAGVTCFVGYNTYHFGYNLGAKSATKLLNSGWLNKMITAAGVLGMFMMGGLAAGFVSVSTPLVIDTGSATILATGQTTLVVYPGVTEVANSAVSLPLPRTLRMHYTIGGTTPSFTFATYFNWIN
jgi:PTS system mannose-specific IID component